MFRPLQKEEAMTITEELHKNLTDMMSLIESGSPPSEGPGIADYLRRIDEIKNELGQDAPKMLIHYLEKRSYTKAIDFLEERDETVASNCCKLPLNNSTVPNDTGFYSFPVM